MPSPRRLAFGALGLCGFLYITVGAAAQTLLNLSFGVWFTEVFVFFGTAWVLVRFSGRAPVRYAGLAIPGPLPPLMGFIFGAVNYFALVIPLQALALRFSPTFLKNLAPDSTRIFEGQTPVELALVLAAVAVAAPFCEEFFFRGVLQQGFARGERRPLRAMVATALLFSVFHMDPVGFWARFELGLLFGWLFVRSGSLWTNVLAHAGNNVTTTALYLLLKGEQKDEGQLPLLPVLALGAVGLSMMFALWRLTVRRPELLEAPRMEEAEEQAPPASLSRLAAPWLLGAVTSLLLLAVVDHRGIRLNALDVLYPLPAENTLSAKARAEEQALVGLRAAVRRGRGSYDDYARRRKSLFSTVASSHPPERRGRGP